MTSDQESPGRSEAIPGKLLSLLRAFLKEHDADNDVHFYSPSEWKARGEDIGNLAALSLTFDGSNLLALLNNAHYEADWFQEDLSSLLEKHGFYFELGNSWSMHIYPLP